MRFYQALGLNVQAFRRFDDDTWLETTQTDHWTLSRQNAEGANTGKDIAHTEEPD